VVDLVGHSVQLGRPRQAEIARVATRQGGPIAHHQLVRLGVEPAAIQQWLRRGRLHQLYRGVYALGHEAVTPKGRLIAALLACGPGAAISHQSCGWWCGYWTPEPDLVDVTAPGRSRKGQRGIRLHLVRNLDPRDVTTRAGVKVTTPERTLLDLAEVTTAQRLRLAIDEADERGLWRPEKVKATLERSPGRRGHRPLRVLLSDLHAEPLLRSELEVAFNKLCDEHRLPRPITNTEVGGYEVDAVWPEYNLVVEVDSRQFHLNGKAFEDDRLKDAELVARGYRVIRVTHRQLKQDPAGAASRIQAALAQSAAPAIRRQASTVNRSTVAPLGQSPSDAVYKSLLT
jgi:very-short-patch-repair endonuclease